MTPMLVELIKNKMNCLKLNSSVLLDYVVDEHQLKDPSPPSIQQFSNKGNKKIWKYTIWKCIKTRI